MDEGRSVTAPEGARRNSPGGLQQALERAASSAAAAATASGAPIPTQLPGTSNVPLAWLQQVSIAEARGAPPPLPPEGRQPLPSTATLQPAIPPPTAPPGGVDFASHLRASNQQARQRAQDATRGNLTSGESMSGNGDRSSRRQGALSPGPALPQHPYMRHVQPRAGGSGTTSGSVGRQASGGAAGRGQLRGLLQGGGSGGDADRSPFGTGLGSSLPLWLQQHAAQQRQQSDSPQRGPGRGHGVGLSPPPAAVSPMYGSQQHPAVSPHGTPPQYSSRTRPRVSASVNGGSGSGMLPCPPLATVPASAAIAIQHHQAHGHGGAAGGGRGQGAQYGNASGSDTAAAMAAADLLSRSAPARGRGGIPHTASISEIEPCVDEEEPRGGRCGGLSSSLSTRAIMIPEDRPRTYRVVAPSRNTQGSQDEVTVVLEGHEGEQPSPYDPQQDRSYRGGLLGSRSARYGSSLPNSGGLPGGASGGGGAGGLLGASLLPGSGMGGGLLGGLFGSRGGGSGRGFGGGYDTPDSSVHGASEGLRYGAACVDSPSLPSGSLPRSNRHHGQSAGAVLGKATGGLMKKSVSYGNFGSAFGDSGGGGCGGSGSGRRAGRNSAAGGSTASSAGTSTGAGGGAGGGGGAAGAGGGGGVGQGFWMRSPGARAGPRLSSASGAGGDADGGGGSGAGGGGGSRPSEPDLADLALLATSLPASLGTWSFPRNVALATSPHNGRALSRADSMSTTYSNATNGPYADRSVHGGSAGTNGPAYLSGNGGGAGPSTSLGGGGGGAAVGPPPPPSYPICLICLEVLTPEDFEAGDAIALQCACKGEVALRHRKCAIEWSHHKGDVVCDICKQPIANLPPIPDEVLAAREAARRRRQPAFNTAAEPNLADYIFDCIRATWVTMIVCVLFFNMTVGRAFMAGAAVGVAFAMVSVVVAACARRARARAAARAVERAAAESREREREEAARQRGGAGRRASGGSGSGGLAQPLLGGE